MAIDDREAKRYAQPVLVIGDLRADFADDGAVPGDVPGDGIWVATIGIDKQEQIDLDYRQQRPSLLDGLFVATGLYCDDTVPISIWKHPSCHRSKCAPDAD